MHAIQPQHVHGEETHKAWPFTGVALEGNSVLSNTKINVKEQN